MLAFLYLTFALLSLFEASAEVLNDNADDSKCLATETPCGSSCCPFTNGTCCIETKACCQQGAACLGPLYVCLGLKSDEKTGQSLYSEQAVQLREVSRCPKGSTSCYGKCCPKPDAVCCSDRRTCCPTGFHCGVDYCYKNEKQQSSFLVKVLPGPRPFYAEKSMVRERPNNLRNWGDNCCPYFLGGYHCCLGSYQICTLFFCW